MQVFLSIALTLVAVTNGAFPKERMDLMNHDMNPCTDFYEYACGKWIQSTKLERFEPIIMSSYATLERQNQKVLQHLVKQNHPIIHNLYKSCMNLEKESIQIGNTPLEIDLKRIEMASTKERLLFLAGEFSQKGTNTFIKFNVEIDPFHPSTKTIIVHPAELTIPMQYNSLLRTYLEDEYQEYIEKLYQLAHYPHPNHAQRVVVLDKQVASLQSTHTHDPSKRLSISQAIVQWPLIFSAFSKGLQLDQVTSVSKNYVITIQHVEYLNAIEKWIETISIEDLKAYLSFLMIHSRAQWIGPAYYNTWFQFFGHEIQRKQKQPSRSQVCIDQMIELIPHVMGKYYYEQVFDLENEIKIKNMISLLKDSLENQLTWLKSEKQAKTKVNRVMLYMEPTSSLGPYPPISSKNYPSNVLSLLSHTFQMEMKTVGKTRDGSHSSSVLPIVKYLPLENKLHVSTAMIQPPFYNGKDAHPALNYGAIGTLIGRELIHSIDHIGQQYDPHGYQKSWWKENDLEEYKKRTMCLKNQYRRFTDENMDETMDETLADHGGLSIAWNAYRHYMNIIQPRIKGIEKGEGDQLFYLSFGQNWCTKATELAVEKMMKTNHIIPAKWRVNGAVMNHPQFAQVFGCQHDDPMNPIDKCPVLSENPWKRFVRYSVTLIPRESR